MASSALSDAKAEVTLGTGLPTREELRAYYPPKFTWTQLKLFINSGDLGLLKRDKVLQRRYQKWAEGIKAEHGSIVEYLQNYRLQWGKPDRLSLLTSEIEDFTPVPTPKDHLERLGHLEARAAEPSTSYPTGYFTADTSPKLISITQNDWPYSVPLEIEHTLVWTKLPLLPPPHLVPSHIATKLPTKLLANVTARLHQDGVWGFTGSLEPPPSPSLLPEMMGALITEWGMSFEKLVISPKGSAEEEDVVKLAGAEVQTFIKRRWIESEWETAWFVNPPRLQSVKGLAHIHVFARKKGIEETSEWIAQHN